MPSVCEQCHAYKQFKDKCWYYWNEKKACSKFLEDETSPETHKSIKEDINSFLLH